MYSVKKLATLSGISVRTLHHYDKIGLLKPTTRTKAGYRLYGHEALLRLQQILFYKELEIPLTEIGEILDNPDFNAVEALKEHKAHLAAKKHRIDTLLTTIDKTIINLKNDAQMKPEDLYNGLSKETALKHRKQATELYGKEMIENSEKELVKLGKAGFENLKQKQKENFEKLFSLRDEDPKSKVVQIEIAKHYQIIRQFWGTANSTDKQVDAYAGLGDLYIDDERFTMINSESQPEFASFLNKAMKFYAKNSLI